MNDDVRCSAEFLWCVDLNRKELRKKKILEIYMHFSNLILIYCSACIFWYASVNNLPCMLESGISHSPWQQSLLLRL